MDNKASAISALHDVIANLARYCGMLDCKDEIRVAFYKKDKQTIEQQIVELTFALNILLGNKEEQAQ